MTSDEKKVLTHLEYRGGYCDKKELEGAWEFENLDQALLDLLGKDLVKALGSSYKIKPKGKEVLKKG